MSELKKYKTHAFGKDVYFLGSVDGDNYYMEAPSWDCEWYWGFGYVETYTNKNRPDLARDISSHQHFKGLWLKKHGDKYRHKLSDWNGFETPLTEKEQWALSDLMQQFYALKEAAEIIGRGSAHIRGHPLCESGIQDKGLAERINKELLPLVFKAVLAILTPGESV